MISSVLSTTKIGIAYILCLGSPIFLAKLGISHFDESDRQFPNELSQEPSHKPQQNTIIKIRQTYSDQKEIQAAEMIHQDILNQVRVQQQQSKQNINKKQKKVIKLVIDWLPHMLFVILLRRGFKVRKQPKKYASVLILAYFWAVTYPFTYKMYKLYGSSYLIPKIYNKIEQLASDL